VCNVFTGESRNTARMGQAYTRRAAEYGCAHPGSYTSSDYILYDRDVAETTCSVRATAKTIASRQFPAMLPLPLLRIRWPTDNHRKFNLFEFDVRSSIHAFFNTVCGKIKPRERMKCLFCYSGDSYRIDRLPFPFLLMISKVHIFATQRQVTKCLN
jgi:hypothetical protein